MADEGLREAEARRGELASQDGGPEARPGGPRSGELGTRRRPELGGEALARRRRVGPGLGGRIVGAVLVTTIATLAVAAVTLLGPLESSLKNAEKTALRSQLKGVASTFRRLDPGNVILSYITATAASRSPRVKAQQARGDRAVDRLNQQEKSIGTRVGASEVTVVEYPDPDRLPQTIVAWPDSRSVGSDRYADAVIAFRTGKPQYTFGTVDGTEYVRAALPFSTAPTQFDAPRQKWVLVVRKPLGELRDAVAAVRTAFLIAVLAGLGLTLLLAIPLAAKLVSRLRRLRQAAIRVAAEGPGADVPTFDRRHDEVGDLANTFATMQSRLQGQEEARRTFVATASHELRTPIASLEGMLELLGDDLSSENPDLPDARELLGRARTQTRRLAGLANDLLHLSRLDSQVQLRSEPVELGELARAVLAEFEPRANESDVRLELRLPDDPAWAIGDPGALAQIVRILLDNAIRVSPRGSEITVDVEHRAAVSLTVRDHGPGVPREEREIIFERFQRGRVTSAQAGFGLGLAIGRELSTRMGGTLTLDDSEAPGAQFTLTVPTASARS